MSCAVTADLNRYQDRMASLEVTEDDVIAERDDLLCADLGEFCEAVFTESFRDEIDTILQTIACTTDRARVEALAHRLKSRLDQRVYAVAELRACDQFPEGVE